MNALALPPALQSWLGDLVSRIPAVEEIWLIGSRANNTARDDSDWDFLALIPNEEALKDVQWETVKRPDIDLLVGSRNGTLSTRWGPEKSLSLASMAWEPKVNGIQATYTSVVCTPDDCDDDSDTAIPQHLRTGLCTLVEKQGLNAFRIFPRAPICP